MGVLINKGLLRMPMLIRQFVFASVVLLSLGNGSSQAAPNQGSPVARTQAQSSLIDCANQALLETLTALIVKSNQLDTSLNFYFSKVRPEDVDNVKATSLAKSKYCVAHVQIMRGQSTEVVDQLDVSYSVVANPDGTFGLAFKPMRQVP
jgi:hypothetical protein